jgi:hypothetical protein
MCPHWINYHGFTRHMSIAGFPRLIVEVLRGAEPHRRLKSLRFASERTNASAKTDFCILTKPKVRGSPEPGALHRSLLSSFYSRELPPLSSRSQSHSENYRSELTLPRFYPVPSCRLSSGTSFRGNKAVGIRVNPSCKPLISSFHRSRSICFPI